MDFVSQRELRLLKRRLRLCHRIAGEIEQRIAAGAYVEPGSLAVEHARVISRESKTKLDQLRIMARLFDDGDFKVVAGDRGIARKFRRDRALVFRLYLRSVQSGVWDSYRLRMDHIRAEATWSRDYPRLLKDTASACFSLLKLRLARVLFLLGVPQIVSVPANTGRLFSYASAAPSYPPSFSTATN